MKGEKHLILNRTAIYGAGAVLRTLTSFVMLPIYTRHLTPADYGVLELLHLIVDLSAILFGARVRTSIFRFHSRASTTDAKQRVITTSLYLTAGSNAVGALLLCAAAAPLSGLMFGSTHYAGALIAFSWSLLFSGLIEVCIAYLRLIDRPWFTVAISFGKLFVQLSLNILFVVYLEMGYWGAVYSALLSSAAVGLLLMLMVLRANGLGADFGLIKPLFGFSWPLIVTGFGMYFISFGDRYFIRAYHDLAQVGIYALAYRFGSIVMALVWAPFMTYWEARQFQLAATDAGRAQIASVLRYVNIPIVCCGLGVALFAKEVIRLIADSAYAAAVPVVPMIVLAYVFQAWTAYTRLGLLHTGKTGYLATSTYITVFLILGLYMLLIPPYGIAGAALATVVSMYIRFHMIFRRSQDQFPIPYRLLHVHVPVLGAALVVLACWSLPLTISAALLKLALFVAFCATLFFSPLVERSVRSELLRYASRLLKRGGRGQVQ